MSRNDVDLVEEALESEASHAPVDNMQEESVASIDSSNAVESPQAITRGLADSPNWELSCADGPNRQPQISGSVHSEAASRKSASLSDIRGSKQGSTQHAGKDPINPEDSGAASSINKSGDPAALTQRYLRLLNTGRLASKEKHMRADASVRRSTVAAGELGEEGDAAKLRSVYEPDIARLRSSARGLEVEPLQQRAGSARSSSSGGGARQPSGYNSGAASPREARPSQRTTSAPRTRSATHNFGGMAAACKATQPNNLMYRRLYAPGPGAYTPVVDRHGGWDGSAFGFGTARQRPPHVCIQEHVFSPGPVYLPSKQALSTSCSSPNFRFGKRSIGTRTDPNADFARNHPHWNPGPGQYELTALAQGGSTEPGLDVPKPVFGTATKLVTPEVNFAATVFVSNGHSLKENVGVHSPGPARYSPERARSLTHTSPAQYSLSLKAPSYFDAFLDPMRQSSPGPIYHTGVLDRKGSKTWGHKPRATFGRGTKNWDPESNLSATVFISHLHAHHVNQGVHSPGPIYSPVHKDHVPTPSLASGPGDRFYDRFEPGRIQ